jgi:hypothetical protein
MINYIIQNFNWPTFFLALALFVLVSNLFNLIRAYYFRTRARRDVGLAEKKISELQARMRAKEAELEEILKKGENK